LVSRVNVGSLEHMFWIFSPVPCKQSIPVFNSYQGLRRRDETIGGPTEPRCVLNLIGSWLRSGHCPCPCLC